jgi:predicted enzyme related to lactoylglutathione lyase
MAQKLNKKLVLITVAADNPDTAVKFYETFFGITFAQSLSDQQVTYHAPIDEGGIMLTVGPKHNAQETVVMYYAVDDLSAAVSESTKAGARVLWGPGDLPVAAAQQSGFKALMQKYYPADAQVAKDWSTLGKAVLLADPAGNGVGLVEVADHVQGQFLVGPHQRALTDVQVSVHQESITLGKQVKASGKP